MVVCLEIEELNDVWFFDSGVPIICLEEVLHSRNLLWFIRVSVFFCVLCWPQPFAFANTYGSLWPGFLQ